MEYNQQQQQEKNTVNKLKLLFLLDKMELPLTENNIIDICTSRNEWINYMDCKEILWQLKEVGKDYEIGLPKSQPTQHNRKLCCSCKQ